MPHTSISHRGISQRIIGVTLAALVAFVMLAFVIAPPAQAHIKDINTDCYGWNIDLSIYSAEAENSIEIWVDGAKTVDIADFGTDYVQTESWDPTEDHILRVRVVAHNDPDGANGASFDDTFTSQACETLPSLKLVKAVDGGTAVADDWTLSATASGDSRSFSNLGGSGTFNTVTSGVAYTLSESGDPAYYSAAGWSCSVNEGPAVPGSSITLANSQSAVCTVTNAFAPPAPAISITKTATPEYYGEDGVGTFTITVLNPGPLPLHDVQVTDELALAVDPLSDCARPVKDLAVDESVTYTCTVGNLDFAGLAPFYNEATSIGTGPYDKTVTSTDDATVFPEVLSTTVTTQAPATTQAPTTTSGTSETLPVTGASGEQMLGFGIAGIILVLAGVMILGGATLIGQRRQDG